MKKKLIYLYFFFFCFLSLFVSGIIDSQDGFQYLAVARNIYYKGEPTAPDYEYDSRKNVHMTTIVGKNGKTYSLTGLGFSLAMVPPVAITDLFYKAYNVMPVEYFPLENDWLILLFASFTNVFFASGIGVVLFLYLSDLGLTKKQALLISLLSIISTNLFAYSKHIYAHTMFAFFALSTFYLIKKYFLTNNKLFLLLSGIAFGIQSITYNHTYLIFVPVIIIYYTLLKIQDNKKKNNKHNLNKTAKDILVFFLAMLPLILINKWFNTLRISDEIPKNLVKTYTQGLVNIFPLTVFIEGLYGQLLSPGRSIFIYSPILLLPIIFWFKFKKKLSPELVYILVLFFLYIIFYSTPFSIGTEQQGITGLWHGESSWGPRYLLPLIPFGALLVGYIYTKISKFQKLFIFTPLVLVGIYVNFLGVIMPYQIKYHHLDKTFFINKTQYTVHVYSNLLPRYSPVIMMTKKLYNLVISLPNIINNGPYNVRYVDGIDFAFNVGPERWRAIEETGYIVFDNITEFPINDLSFDLINHPVKGTDSPVTLNYIINNKPYDQTDTIKVGERTTVKLSLNDWKLKEKDNQLIIKTEFKDKEVVTEHSQILGLITFLINDHPINKESIDVPYVSDLGRKMGYTYYNWGGTNNSGWKMWDIHTQIYERVPDFWWTKPFFYWDIPNKPIITLLIINILGVLYFGANVFRDHFSTKK